VKGRGKGYSHRQTSSASIRARRRTKSGDSIILWKTKLSIVIDKPRAWRRLWTLERKGARGFRLRSLVTAHADAGQAERRGVGQRIERENGGSRHV